MFLGRAGLTVCKSALASRALHQDIFGGNAIDHVSLMQRKVDEVPLLLTQMTAKSTTERVHSGGRLNRETRHQPCKCELSKADWKIPTRTNSKCIFIDLGAADGDTFKQFLSGAYERIPQCTKGDWEAILVEANPLFTESLKRLEKEYPGKVQALSGTAAYCCEAKTTFFVDNDQQHHYWGSTLDAHHHRGEDWLHPQQLALLATGEATKQASQWAYNYPTTPPATRCPGANNSKCNDWGRDCYASEMWGEPVACSDGHTPERLLDNWFTCCPPSKVTVPTVNVMRLIAENAIPDDFVILKMDIEGAEYDVVPSLADSPYAGIVDSFFVETHPASWQLGNTTYEMLQAAKQVLYYRGVDMPEYFSPTL